MYDSITTLGNSNIQHGTYNDRIYLIKLSQADFPAIIPKLDSLASQKGYTKLFAKVPGYARDTFLENDYRIEASIPKFYNANQTAYFMGKYFSETRKQSQNLDLIKDVLIAARSKSKIETPIVLPSCNFIYRECHEADVLEMTELYKKIFKTYPFPIHDPDYIAETIKNNVTYFGIWHNQSLVALASAEMDLQASNVEMTDFATLPDFRDKGLSTFLLQTMGNYVQRKGIKTAYTIARSISYGMNTTFAKMGYFYSGTLINNTNISGSLECMNIWYHHLSDR
ncbi:putative beta-lysine N-acetyltransferase [Desulfosporosinus sp.]|uniref:putative beta-lysine N-acetyltransferase n=1 Tax=Desulfosporosinus sp. TaxID=157907 RepID=UPI0025C61839|nr:putative beta-lysine N-acetyltransferase [Desulfosporosinus sp.]MBC2723898.1 putative beta-lysine N-acetyltransferase [Desulfosporosinus sp.]MBC2726553.1 putative beta-lysine N-acetyltransferase [Desulfosporosinus sp.]